MLMMIARQKRFVSPLSGAAICKFAVNSYSGAERVR